MEQREVIQQGLEAGNIDLLVGNHKHAQNSRYIDDRIVILDEFNPDPFLEQFPSDGDIHDADHAGSIVSHFLNVLKKQDVAFPTEAYGDVTDVLLNRESREHLEAALEWFEEHGVTRADVIDLDFYNISSYIYDDTHRLAPFLTLAFLCMRKVGDGIELAPPPEEYDVPRLRKAWTQSAIHGNVRCIRDRNTGEVYLLRPPDLESAEQVIGLDALPSRELWKLVFAPGSEFQHERVIRRDEFSQYLSSALKMTVKQVGDGRYPYAGGRISGKDKYRFAAIKALEDSHFALISTKKALEEYESRKWLDWFVKYVPRESGNENVDGQYAVMNYAKVVSSNAFEEQDLGVVSGTPFPGYELMRIWAGLFGEEVPVPDEGETSEFEGITEDILHYFREHQVIQAILRFGRHKRIWSNDGSTIYVNTTALPDWFETATDLTVETDTKRTELIEYLIKAKRADNKEILSEQNTRSLHESLDMNRSYITDLLGTLEANNLVSVSDRGKGGSKLYQWTGDDSLQEADVDDQSHLLKVGEKVYFLNLD